MKRARLKHWWTIAILVVMVIALHDFTRPHGRGIAARGAIFAIDEYRAHVSPRLGGLVTCRFHPTCSRYGREAFRKYGFGKGLWLTSKRLVKCGPWTKKGTVDWP